MSSLRSRSIFASFAVMAIVAVAFAGISFIGDDSDAANSYSVGDTISGQGLFAVGGQYVSHSGSIPGITISYEQSSATSKLVGTGTFTAAGSYTLTLQTSLATDSTTIVVVESGSVSPSEPDIPSYPSEFNVGETISSQNLFAVGGEYSSHSGSIPGITINYQQSSAVAYLVGSGTFTKAGSYILTLQTSLATDSVTITVTGSSEDPIDFTSPAAVDSVSGSSIKYQATTNITGSTFKATGSDNASWLTITSAGLLSGTAPSVSQKTSYTYSIQATSPGGQTVVQKVTFDVYPVAQLKATSSTITGTVGSAISSVTVSSNIACTLTLQDSSKLTDLGLSFNSSTGVISGTPTKTGSAVVKILGSTTVGPAQTPSIEISVSVGEAALKITSEPPTGVFAVGKNYTYNLSANQDVTWSITGAPSWLSLSGSKVVGQVTGITEAGTITYSVTATTSGGQTATQQVTISVEPTIAFTSVPKASCSVTPVYDYKADGSFSLAGFLTLSMTECDAAVPVLGALMDSGIAESALDYTAPDAVSAITGSKFTYNPATNITGTTFSKVSGADWLILSNGVVSGTAPSVTEKTDYQIVIRAKSPYNQTIDQTVTITVYPIVKLTASALSTSVHEGSLMNEITVTSNVAVTWSKSGDLPAGVTFSDGKLSGTPTAQGSFPVTIYGASVEGPSQTASIKVTIVVGEPVLKITSFFPTSMFLVGKQYSYTVETNVPDCTFTLGSDKPAWATLNGAAIGGQITGYTDGTTVKFTVTAESPQNQTASQEISVTIEPVIAFTSVPTASCIIMAEYVYGDDGSFFLKGSNVLMMSLAAMCMSASAIPSVFEMPVCEAVSASMTPVSSFALGDSVSAEGDSEGGSSSAVSAPDISENGTRTFKFVWTGEDAERVIWDFGDGTTGEGFQITHTYDKNGTYTYTCTGINSIGSSSVSGTITVDVADDGISTFVLIGIGILLLIAVICVVRHSSKRNAGFSERRR